MLRDYTESFAAEFSNVLKEFNLEETADSFQLLKFERIDPDVFIWLLRSDTTYAVTISDRAGDLPGKEYVAKWIGNFNSSKLTPIPIAEGNYTYKDDFDYVKIYQLPKDYDHDDFSGAQVK